MSLTCCAAGRCPCTFGTRPRGPPSGTPRRPGIPGRAGPCAYTCSTSCASTAPEHSPAVAHAAGLPAAPPQDLAPLAPAPARTADPSPPQIVAPGLLREHEVPQSPQMVTHDQWPPI